jgi:excisionase family DNA binding protein
MDVNGERLLVTVAEAAERLSLSASLLYQMARRDELPAGCVTRVGRAVRLNWPRIRQWAEAGGTAAEG